MRHKAQLEPRPRTPECEHTFVDTVVALADEEDLERYFDGGDFSMSGRHPAGIARIVERLSIAGVVATPYLYRHPSGPPYTRLMVGGTPKGHYPISIPATYLRQPED